MSLPLLAYGAFAYFAFLAVFGYVPGFLLDLVVPKTINSGTVQTPLVAVAINVGLVFLFGFFHSLMAREKFKRVWTRVIPPAAERSTYVLQSAVFLAIAMAFWQPMPTVLWSLSGPAVAASYVLFVIGVGTVFWATFAIDHFELFGLSQVWHGARGTEMPKQQFHTPGLYRVVRHPMQLGVTLLMLSTPVMTMGHLLFAGLMILYILIGLWFEERSLVRTFGDTYRQYQASVPMLIPGLKGLRTAPNTATS